MLIRYGYIFREYSKCLFCIFVDLLPVVIFFFLVWMRRLAAGMGFGVRSMPTGSFGWEGSDVPRPETHHEPKGNITDDPSRCINEDVGYKLIYIYIYIYTRIYKDTCTDICNIYTPIHIHIYTCVYLCVYVCQCVCVRVYVLDALVV